MLQMGLKGFGKPDLFQHFFVVFFIIINQFMNLALNEKVPSQLHQYIQIIDKNKILSSLPVHIQKQFGCVLNLFKEEAQKEGEEMLPRLKQKIALIFYDEGEGIKDYIKLQKFKKLSPPAMNALEEIVRQIVYEFSVVGTEDKYDNEKVNKAVREEEMKKKRLLQLENFHLRNYHLFLSKIGTEANQMYPYPVFDPRNFNPIQTDPQYTFPHLQMPTFNPDPNPKSQNSKNNLEQDPSIKFQEEVEVIKEKRERRQSQDPFVICTDKRDRKEKKDSKFFIMCACKGKIGQDKKFFTCPRCQKGFHYECLLLESEIGILYKRTDVICPPCAVKNPNTNIYYNILGEVESSYVNQNDLLNKKIAFKMKKIKEFLQRNCEIHVRIIKVIGDTLKTDEEVEQRKQQQKRLFTEIALQPRIFEGKGDIHDVKLFFEDFPIEREALILNPKPTMFYYGVFAVKPIDEEDLTQYFLKTCKKSGKDNLIKLMGEKQKCEINVHKNNNKYQFMTIPARGLDCKHIEVFDLEDFMIEQQKFGGKKCPICETICRSFVIDEEIQKFIKDRLVNSEAPDRIKHIIFNPANESEFFSKESIPEPEPVESELDD